MGLRQTDTDGKLKILSGFQDFKNTVFINFFLGSYQMIDSNKMREKTPRNRKI